MLTVQYLAGTSVAGFIGGGCSHPYERFPKIFGWSKFWKHYPYALPCFISASFCVSAFAIAFLWLKEVRRGVFLSFGDGNKLRNQSLMSKRDKAEGCYGTFTRTDNAAIGKNVTPVTPLLPKPSLPPPPPMRDVLTPRVRMAILNNGSIALVGGILIQQIVPSPRSLYS